MKQLFASNSRYYFVGILILVGFMTVLGRLYYLHVIRESHLNAIAEQNRKQFRVMDARRGNILDLKGNVLATTKSVIELGVDPQMLKPEDKAKWPALAKLLKMSVHELSDMFSERIRAVEDEYRLVRWKKLAESIDEDLYKKVQALRIKGVYGNRKFERVYPGGRLGAHVLGFVNKEGIAVTGIERYMDFYLRGQSGWLESEKDGRRRELAQFRSREVLEHDGRNVELSIDLVIQHIIEEELENIAAELNPDSASIIVSDPSTGFILAMANYPTFNPNEYWKSDVDTHRNRAVSDVYEPGSTFKIVASSAAFEEALVHIDDEVDCGIGKVMYNGRMVRLPKDYKLFEVLSIRDVVQKSSNRGTAYLGMLLGEERLLGYARAFGFGSKLGYGPGGEVSGIVHDVSQWDGLTISRFPMGHAIGATALQVNYAMSVIANQGVLMQPKVVRRVFSDNGETIIEYLPESKRRVLSVKTAKKMAALLGEVTGPNGTSKRAAVKGITVAGKSGTSQKIIDGRYSRSQHVASFSGFFPAEAPKVVMTVVIDDAKVPGTAYGGAVAAPRFKNIAEPLVQYLNIKPTTGVNNRLLAWKGKSDVRN